MSPIETTQDVPITVHDDGCWKVTGTRITVDVVIGLFKNGSTAEQILDDFPTLQLASIYGVIGYYLTNPAPVEKYLTDRQREANKLQNRCESLPGIDNFRQKVRDARNQLATIQ